MTEGALARLRVLDCGEMVAAPYAAKLLAHMGADVVKVEPPEGDPARRRGPFPNHEPHPERSGLHLYLNQGKRGVTVDWTKEEGRTLFRQLAANVDAVIVSGSPRSIEERGLTYDALCEVNPRLVVTTITPFGMSGPRRDWAATEIVEVAAGGWLYISPGALKDPSLPPLKAFGHQADFQGGAHGALATMAALMARELTGSGQHVDVSVQAVIAGGLEMNFMHWTYAGRVASRLGQRAVGPWGIINVADGPFMVVCVEQDQWERLIEFLGHPEWANSEIFADGPRRGQNLDALMPLIEEAMSHLTREQAYTELQARRVPCAPVYDPAGLLQSDHLAARGFFIQVDHPQVGGLTYPGAPFKFTETPWEVRRRAPLLGEHREEILTEWA